MGTRNLTVVVIGGEAVVAQYGQWDGYPSGAGKDILEFLTERFNKDLFVKRLKDCKILSNKAAGDLWNAEGEENSTQFYETYPQLSRDMGARVLEHIQNSTGECLLSLDLEFGQESVMCEWAYVLDLDTDELKVYEGFNDTNPIINGIFAGERQGEYYPVKLKEIFPIDENIPTYNKFIGMLEPDEAIDDDDIMKVIDHIRSGDHGDEAITEAICDYLQHSTKELIDVLQSRK